MRRLWWSCLVLIGCGSNEPAATPDAAVSPDAHVDAGHDADASAEIAEDIPPPPVPATLAETGLYADFASKTLATGVLSYDVNYPLWSDGAEKARYLYVPPGKTIGTSDVDHWVFPVGTKAWKEFRVGGKLVETRYFEKTDEPPLGWRYVGYAWNADGTAATAAPSGVTNTLGTSHDIPDQAACENCHSGTRDGLIGVGAIQLSGRLAELSTKGIFDKPPAAEYPVPGTGNVQEVLGYLHGNCGYCHSDVGRWSAVRPMRLHVPVGLTDATKSPLYLTAINQPMAHADLGAVGVLPKSPDQSQLFVRITRRNLLSMPPVGTEVVDDAAVAKIKAWIESL